MNWRWVGGGDTEYVWRGWGGGSRVGKGQPSTLHQMNFRGFPSPRISPLWGFTSVLIPEPIFSLAKRMLQAGGPFQPETLTMIFPFPGALRQVTAPPDGGQYGLKGAALPLPGAGGMVWIRSCEL